MEGLSHVLVDPDNGNAGSGGHRRRDLGARLLADAALYKREREDVFTPDGYYRTGDCGVEYDDGWIKFTGRLG